MEKSKQEKVLDYLNRYGSITPMEAVKSFDNYRLAVSISSLRKKGYNIVTINEGNKHIGAHARYVLVSDGAN